MSLAEYRTLKDQKFWVLLEFIFLFILTRQFNWITLIEEWHSTFYDLNVLLNDEKNVFKFFDWHIDRKQDNHEQWILSIMQNANI